VDHPALQWSYRKNVGIRLVVPLAIDSIFSNFLHRAI
jgi:hypothetical protein